jgi:hypothetical protein
MRVSDMTDDDLAQLAYECGILVLKKMVFNVNKKKFEFDEYVLDGDLVALKQFASVVAKLEVDDEL